MCLLLQCVATQPAPAHFSQRRAILRMRKLDRADHFKLDRADHFFPGPNISTADVDFKGC